MSQELLVTLLGGLLPIIITSLVAWTGGRNRESRRARALESARQRVDFINAYLAAQVLANDAKRTGEIRQRAVDELEQTKSSLDAELAEIEAQGPGSQSFIGQFLLLYKMKSFWSDVLRLAFLIALLASLAWSMYVTRALFTMYELGESNLPSVILGLLVYAALPILAALFIRWLAILTHRRARRA